MRIDATRVRLFEPLQAAQAYDVKITGKKISLA